MPIKIQSTVFSVKFQEGKSGNYAIVKLMNKQTKDIIELYVRDIAKASELQAYEDELVNVEIELKPFKNSYFLGNILNIEAVA